MKAIITFIIIFGVIVFIHEFGHFFFAKRAGILVREFAIGMGPKLFYHRDRTGTAYTLRLLPVGGYVRMAGWGEDSEKINPGTPLTLLLDEKDVVQKINLSKKVTLDNGLPFEVEKIDLEKDLLISGYLNGDDSKLVTYHVDHDALLVEEDGTEIRIAPIDVQVQSATVPWRIMTNIAGPMNNFLLGIILFIMLAFMQGGTPINNTTQIAQVLKGSIAAKAGLKNGDYIKEINGKKVSNWNEIGTELSEKAGEKITLKVQRTSKFFSLKFRAKKATASKSVIEQLGISQPYDKSLVSGILIGGFSRAMRLSTAILKAIVGLFTGFSLNKLGGPVAIFQMSQAASAAGLNTVIYIMAMLSLNLGFVNLFPIPALDGGKILLNIIEGIRGKPLSKEKEGIITLIGVGIMVVLMILVTWNDITRFFMK